MNACDLEAVTDQLFALLQRTGWDRSGCERIAPKVQRIRQLAAERRAVILAHSYQTPDIQFGIADFRGDSLGLARDARKAEADVIVFCGVRFMAETAKILCPRATVLLPAPDAGCSLSESITGADVRALRAQHPDAAFVCYINTTADVKAECDAVCTSANALDVVEGVPGRRVVFVPDRFMAENLQALTKKEIIGYPGRCVVHETFTRAQVLGWKAAWPDAKVLVHTESRPEVVALADMAGGTGDMIRYVQQSPAKRFMLVTECGLSDRLRVEYPDREFIGSCTLCEYMKKTTLDLVLQALEAPRPEQIVDVEESIRGRAQRALDEMFRLTTGGSKTRPHSGPGESAGRA